MKAIETTQELFELSKGHQLNAQQVINRRMFIDDEWTDIVLLGEFQQQFASDITQALGGWASTKRRMYFSLMNETPQHWGLCRLFLKKHGEEYTWNYCAGQDYPAELRMIRKYLAR